MGGGQFYGCLHKGSVWDKIPKDDQHRIIEERLDIECPAFVLSPREMRIKMKEMTEIGITVVHGDGRTQIPKDIRDMLRISDGDKILWLRKGFSEFTFRKVGMGSYKPHYT